MKKYLAAISLLVILLSLTVLMFPKQTEAYVSVRGYFRSNGTYVSPSIRSNPNSLRYDNYGYTGGSLFNPSFSGSTRNYSSNWYTPSYLTDPSYFSGKNLYRGGGSLYNLWGY